MNRHVSSSVAAWKGPVRSKTICPGHNRLNDLCRPRSAKLERTGLATLGRTGLAKLERPGMAKLERPEIANLDPPGLAELEGLSCALPSTESRSGRSIGGSSGLLLLGRSILGRSSELLLLGRSSRLPEGLWPSSASAKLEPRLRYRFLSERAKPHASKRVWASRHCWRAWW